MNRRNYLSSLALGALALSLFGCTPKGSTDASATTGGTAPAAPAASAAAPAGDKVSVAFVTNNPSDYWTIARKGTEAAAKELPNVDVQFVMPADGTAATQKSQVDDLIAKGVKAIAISPVDPKNQTPWLNEVAGKTALITQDSDAPDSKRLVYIGTDNHAAGLQAGELIKKALPAGGKIMLFVGKRDADNAKQRESGIRDSLKGSNVTILDVRTDDTDHGRAKSNASDALVKYPDIAALVGLWSYNGPAILSAVQDAGKIGKVKIVCFDEEPATLAGIKAGSIYATVVQHPYLFGYQGVKMLYNLAQGKPTDPPIPAGKQIIVPTRAITTDTLDEFQKTLTKERGPS